MSVSILVAGIGNIFHGDDSFGVAVVQKLAQLSFPENVRVVDFGIRAIDLAFALLDGYDVTILVDATTRGGTPGTLYTIEPDLQQLTEAASDGTFSNSHALDPERVLILARSMGAELRRVLLIGCEPLTLGDDEDGHIGLSEIVEMAVDPAVKMICSLVQELTESKEVTSHAGGC